MTSELHTDTPHGPSMHTDAHSATTSAPVADWVTIPELYEDPFPIYERLRAEGGVHWVPAVNRYLITSYDAVSATEHDQDVFSADEEGSLQIRARGHSMLRRDDPEHYAQRRAWQPVLKPGYVKRVWTKMYRDVAEDLLDKMVAKGPDVDLIWDFAAPYAAEARGSAAERRSEHWREDSPRCQWAPVHERGRRPRRRCRSVRRTID